MKYQSLVGLNPKDILPYGPTKLLVDEYLWHNPQLGCIASYTVKEEDVKDHYGLFRGVDQLEFFAQSSVVSLGIFHITNNLGLSHYQLQEKYYLLFLGVDKIRFHYFVKCNEKIVSIGVIKKYAFRQMICSGRIYKVPKDFDIGSYCSFLNTKDVENFKLHDELKIVAEFENAVGWYIKKGRLEDKK